MPKDYYMVNIDSRYGFKEKTKKAEIYKINMGDRSHRDARWIIGFSH